MPIFVNYVLNLGEFCYRLPSKVFFNCSLLGSYSKLFKISLLGIAIALFIWGMISVLSYPLLVSIFSSFWQFFSISLSLYLPSFIQSLTICNTILQRTGVLWFAKKITLLISWFCIKFSTKLITNSENCPAKGSSFSFWYLILKSNFRMTVF